MSTPLTFMLIAAVLGAASAVSYLRHERSWKPNARIWLRLALLFAAISAYLQFAT